MVIPIYGIFVAQKQSQNVQRLTLSDAENMGNSTVITGIYFLNQVWQEILVRVQFLSTVTNYTLINCSQQFYRPELLIDDTDIYIFIYSSSIYSTSDHNSIKTPLPSHQNVTINVGRTET